VDATADEPFRVRRLPVEHLIPGTRPFELVRKARPERFRIARRVGVNLLVAHDRLRAEFGRRREGAIFTQQIRELGLFVIRHGVSPGIRAATREDRSRSEWRSDNGPILHRGFGSPWRNSSCIRPALHPGWLRCASFKYSRYCTPPCTRRTVGAPLFARRAAPPGSPRR